MIYFLNSGPLQIYLMLVLGFDFGLKYIGVAVGQKITKTATPVATIFIGSSVDKLSCVLKYIDSWSPDVIVFGLPFSYDFKNKYILKNIKYYIFNLRKKCNIPIYSVNENLSTWKAKRNSFFFKKKQKKFFNLINAISAAILIEQWFFEIDI